MPKIHSNYSLQKHNTFGIAAKARFFVSLTAEEELNWLLKQPEYQNQKVLWLGGGSNLLLTQDFDGLVVQLNFKGTQIDFISESDALLKAAAGENWHQLVLYALELNLGGLENLALIPGNVGTAPIQNIGAYGVELKDTFYQLRAFDLKEKAFKIFSKEECHFGYRDSYFKNEGKGRFIITEVTFKLSSKNHKVNTEYGAIRQELQKQDLMPSIHNIAQAVISIRLQKLPNPAEIGNSGSFFKNPIVDKATFTSLKEQYPHVAHYVLESGKVKLAAGWLIEQAGWKGYRKGDAGVHAKQALVLVNYGKASGTEIYSLAKEVSESVFRKFAVKIIPEVNIIE
jgi:UDP-N-acetylmuramate dehydrogenase